MRVPLGGGKESAPQAPPMTVYADALSHPSRFQPWFACLVITRASG